MYKDFFLPIPPGPYLGLCASGQDASVIGDRTDGLDNMQDEARDLLSAVFVSSYRSAIGPIGHHLNTNTLEEYALGVLNEAEREIVEDHVLACDFCTGNLEKADWVIALLKAVLTATISPVCH